MDAWTTDDGQDGLFNYSVEYHADVAPPYIHKGNGQWAMGNGQRPKRAVYVGRLAKVARMSMTALAIYGTRSSAARVGRGS